MDGQAILDFFEERLRFCREQRLAYQAWIGLLSPVKWLTVGGSVILSSFAGLNALIDQGLLGAHWQLSTALAAFGAGLLTALHANLRCDEHQNECHRIIRTFQSIELAYEAARTESPENLATKRDEIEVRIQGLVENAMATPAEFCRRRAEAIIRRMLGSRNNP